MAQTVIERELVGNDAHWLLSFEVQDRNLTIEVCPHHRPEDKRTIVFRNAEVISAHFDEDEDGFPKNIIGMNSNPSGDRLEFVLACDDVEWHWLSSWPELPMQN